MADTYLVSAQVITWKAGDGAKAVQTNSDDISEIFEASNVEHLKQKVLAKWIQTRPAPDRDSALENMLSGMVTVEFKYHALVTPPTLSDEQTKAQAEATLAAALGKVLEPFLNAETMNNAMVTLAETLARTLGPMLGGDRPRK